MAKEQALKVQLLLANLSISNGGYGKFLFISLTIMFCCNTYHMISIYNIVRSTLNVIILTCILVQGTRGGEGITF